MPIRRPSILNSLSRNSIVSNNENKSPIDTPPQCKSPTPTGPSLKDTRAFEHDRQRLKKAAALLARKARAQQPPSQSPPTKPKRPGHGGRHGHGVNVDIDNDEPAVEENEVEVGEAMSLSLRLGVDAGLVPTQALQETVAPPLQAEVALTDLLIPRKPRRKVLDFEVVPPLRSVIVLDDIALPELEYDEPWEHVYASDASSSSEDSEGPTATRMDTNKPVSLTYAKIAALN